jgi:transcription antitermination factor NusG
MKFTYINCFNKIVQYIAQLNFNIYICVGFKTIKQSVMTPNKQGQIVKFHTPLDGENLEQLYVVLEVIDDDERPRADIQALNTGLSFPPINTVRLSDLEVVEVNTQDLIGHHVTINKADYSQVDGKVISVNEQKIHLDLSQGIKGVETNVYLTVVDIDGKEHTGTLFVNPE